jgi:hypothetical protein
MEFSQVDLHRMIAIQCDRFGQVVDDDLCFTMVHDFDQSVLRIISGDDEIAWWIENVTDIREWAWIALGVEWLVLEADEGIHYCARTFPFFGCSRKRVLYLNRKRRMIRLYGCNTGNSSD